MARKTTKKKLRFRQSLFWDIDPRKINPDKHARYVIERIMNLGYDKEVIWMWRYYPHALLQDVANNSRDLDPKSQNFWRLIVSLKPRPSLRVLEKPFSRTRTTKGG